MVYIVDYWTCGDTLIINRRVEAETKEQAVATLAGDPQAPLGQLKSIREEASEGHE